MLGTEGTVSSSSPISERRAAVGAINTANSELTAIRNTGR